MSFGQIEVGNHKNITSTTLIKASQGVMLGFFCNSTSSGTVAFYDTAAADTANAITGTITPSAGTFYRIPVAFANGLRAVIANTLDITAVYI